MKLRRALVIAALIAFSGDVYAQGMSIELRREQHGAWQLVCYRDRIDDTTSCFLSTPFKGARADMPALFIGTTLPRENPVLRVRSPGIINPTGGLLRTGDRPAERLTDCAGNSCGVTNADATVDDIVAGGALLVRISTRAHGVFEGEADMTGFKAGYTAWRKAVQELKK